MAERDLTQRSGDWLRLLAKRLAGIPLEVLDREATDPASRDLLTIIASLEKDLSKHFLKASDAQNRYGLCKGQIKQDIHRRKIRPREVYTVGRENIIAVSALERLYGEREGYDG